MKTTPTPPPAPASSDVDDFAEPPRRRRWLPWAIGVVVLVLIGAGMRPKAVPVETAVVARGPLRVTVQDEGQTRVRQRFVVAAPVAGQLRRVELKAGASVVAGETVLAVFETAGASLLDARELARAQAAVRAAESGVELAGARRESAVAAHTLAQAELARVEALAGRAVISQQEQDAAVARATMAAQELRGAEWSERVAGYELEQARAMLGRGLPEASAETTLTVRAPVSGRVLRVWQESARPVVAGLPILEVGDPTDLEVQIEVLSRDGVAIAPGAAVELEQWGGAAPLPARVRLVEPGAFTKVSALGVEEQRVHVIADLMAPVEQRPTLGDGYRVEARVVVWEAAEVLLAPAGALFQRGERWSTFVLAGGRAEQRAVEVGRSDGVHTEVRGGLEAGEVVVLYPGDRVTDGGRVAPRAATD